MSGKSRLTINGKTIAAPNGLTLIEAGLQAGLVMPQDCCTGQCQTCRVDVLSGSVDAKGTAEGASVLACQACVTGDAEIHYDPVPAVMKTGGSVIAINDLGGEIVEVIIEVTKPVPYLPGQYVKVAFSGFPARDFSPTLTLNGLREINQLIFHIRRATDGLVSSALGGAIKAGHRVKVTGPYGHAFLRQGEGRIVLISTGTGFAPIWSIAVAARLGQPHRPLTLIASARDPRNLYMRESCDWLARHGVEDIVLTASGANPLPPARHGRASAHLPSFRATDTVYVAGTPGLVDLVRSAAQDVGAKCYSDPFLPSTSQPTIGMKIRRFLGGKPGKPSPVHAQIETLAASLAREKT